MQLGKGGFFVMQRIIRGLETSFRFCFYQKRATFVAGSRNCNSGLTLLELEAERRESLAEDGLD